MGRKSKIHLTEQNGIVGKECSKCEVWKPLEDFYKGGSLGGRSSNCKVCWINSVKLYYQKNREEKLEYQRQHERKNRERRLKYKQQYRQVNREATTTHRQNYRARKKGLPDTLTLEQWGQILEFFGGCALTGATENLAKDHVIPLAVGHGGTTKKNMIPLSADLNNSKNDRNLFDWFESEKERFDLSQEKFDALIVYLAELNEMNIEQYREYVYWCHENPRRLGA
jgi:hypothetical protein